MDDDLQNEKKIFFLDGSSVEVVMTGKSFETCCGTSEEYLNLKHDNDFICICLEKVHW